GETLHQPCIDMPARLLKPASADRPTRKGRPGGRPLRGGTGSGSAYQEVAVAEVFACVPVHGVPDPKRVPGPVATSLMKKHVPDADSAAAAHVVADTGFTLTVVEPVEAVPVATNVSEGSTAASAVAPAVA